VYSLPYSNTVQSIDLWERDSHPQHTMRYDRINRLNYEESSYVDHKQPKCKQVDHCSLSLAECLLLDLSRKNLICHKWEDITHQVSHSGHSWQTHDVWPKSRVWHRQEIPVYEKECHWTNNDCSDCLPFITIRDTISKVWRMSECRNKIRPISKDIFYFRFNFSKCSVGKKGIDYLIDLIIATIIRRTCTKNRWQFYLIT
jgi:hypothetical protein